MSDELGFIPAAGTLLIPILNKSHNRIPHNYKVLQYCIYEVLRRLGGGHMIQLLFIFPGGWFIEKTQGNSEGLHHQHHGQFPSRLTQVRI